MIDTRMGPPFSITPLTQDGITVNETNPKTDGKTIVWRAQNGAEEHVIMHEIATGQQTVISTTTNPKFGISLQIDSKQVLWLEGVNLFFHDGSGESSGADLVDPGNVPFDAGFLPHLSDGLVTWIGNDGDTEVFIME